MATYWLLSFFSFFSLVSILVIRSGIFGKPTRQNNRDTPLRLPPYLKQILGKEYVGGNSVQTEGDTLLIERNREDIVYGALRALN